MIMRLEVLELVGQDVRVWDYIKMVFSKSFLHFNEVVAESVLSSNFKARREVVDFLVFIQSLVQVRLATRRAPEDVPFVALSVGEPIDFQ